MLAGSGIFPHLHPPVRKSKIKNQKSKIRKRLLACLLPLLLGIILVLIGQHFEQKDSGIVYLREDGYKDSGIEFKFDPTLGWLNIPGLRGVTFGRKLSINSFGHRDADEYELEPSAESARILVLGDSFTWGYHVSDEEVYTELLEEGLRADGFACEVFNGGVSGWGTDQEYLYLIHHGWKFSPRIVLLSFFLLNDLDDNARSLNQVMEKPLFKNLELDLLNVPLKPPIGGYAPSLQKFEGNRYDLTINIIRKMAESCEEHGAKFLIVKFGNFYFPGDERRLGWEKEFESRLTEKLPDVPYLDLDTEFEKLKLKPDSLAFGFPKGHWNSKGHRHAAEIIKDFVQSAGTVGSDQ